MLVCHKQDVSKANANPLSLMFEEGGLCQPALAYRETETERRQREREKTERIDSRERERAKTERKKPSYSIFIN